MLLQVVSEERKRLGERPAENHFGAAISRPRSAWRTAETRTGSSVLQHGDCAEQMNARGLSGNRRQHDLWSRHRKVRTMMLADTEEVQTDLVGHDRFGHDMAKHLGL